MVTSQTKSLLTAISHPAILTSEKQIHSATNCFDLTQCLTLKIKNENGKDIIEK